MKSMNLPNKLTVLRVILIPFFVLFMLGKDFIGAFSPYVALIIFIVEPQIPNPFPIPGVKLGLANIVVEHNLGRWYGMTSKEAFAFAVECYANFIIQTALAQL
jgi:hypothetical protein